MLPSPLQSSTLANFTLTLVLKLFREENQLSPSSIGISPLTTGHPGEHFVAYDGSALHYLLQQLQPAHG